jgi:hypothetical protein
VGKSKNEQIFAYSIEEKFGTGYLQGKQDFKDYGYKVEVSVDESMLIDIGDGIEFLFEIDTHSSPKPLAGQYTTLNMLYDKNKLRAVLVVVLFNSNLDPKRIIRRFNLINDKLFTKQGIRFCVITEIELDNIIGESEDIADFLRRLFKVSEEQNSISR